jgi:hypothetical protein
MSHSLSFGFYHKANRPPKTRGYTLSIFIKAIAEFVSSWIRILQWIIAQVRIAVIALHPARDNGIRLRKPPQRAVVPERVVEEQAKALS